LHDVLGLSTRTLPKFARQYVDLETAARSAVEAYAADVRNLSFPSDAETYHSASNTRAN
jgi:ketopantoate hydroxymethyltransferase